MGKVECKLKQQEGNAENIYFLTIYERFIRTGIIGSNKSITLVGEPVPLIGCDFNGLLFNDLHNSIFWVSNNGEEGYKLNFYSHSLDEPSQK